MRLLSLSWSRLIRGITATADRHPARVPGKTVGGEEVSRRGSVRWVLIMGAAVGLLHFFLFPPLPRIDTEFPAAGEIADKEIRAPFSFRAPFLELDVEMRRLQKVLAEPPAMSSLGARPLQDARARLAAWNEALRRQRDHPEVQVPERVGYLSLRFPGVPEEYLRSALTAEDIEQVGELMAAAVNEVLESGVADLLPTGSYTKVWVVSDGTERQVEVDQVTPQSGLGERLTALLRRNGLGAGDAIWAASLLRHFITPNLVYDPEETRARQDRARRSVPTEREFIKGERIVDHGVRVTEQEALFLSSLHDLLVATGGLAEDSGRFSRPLTRLLLVGVALALFGWLGWIHFPAVLAQPRFLVALAASLALFLAGAAFALGQPGLGPFAAPIPLLALLATVLFKDRVGYAVTLLAIVLLGVLPEVATGSVFVWLVLGMVTVVAVRRIQKRSQFYQTIALLTLLSVFLITVLRVGEGVGLGGWGGSTWSVCSPPFSRWPSPCSCCQ